MQLHYSAFSRRASGAVKGTGYAGWCGSRPPQFPWGPKDAAERVWAAAVMGCGSSKAAADPRKGQPYEKKKHGAGINPEHRQVDPNFELKVYEKDEETTQMLKQVRCAREDHMHKRACYLTFCCRRSRLSRTSSFPRSNLSS